MPVARVSAIARRRRSSTRSPRNASMSPSLQEASTSFPTELASTGIVRPVQRTFTTCGASTWSSTTSEEAPPTVSVAASPASDRKSTRLNSSHMSISYAVFCLKKQETPPRPSYPSLSNRPPPPPPSPLSLHDALPIFAPGGEHELPHRARLDRDRPPGPADVHHLRRVDLVEHDQRGGAADRQRRGLAGVRSEEHTSELQSHVNIVCRLLLEKTRDTAPTFVSFPFESTSPPPALPSFPTRRSSDLRSRRRARASPPSSPRPGSSARSSGRSPPAARRPGRARPARRRRRPSASRPRRRQIGRAHV